MTEDRRNETGFYFTGKQFAGLLAGILSVQLGVNWWAAQTFVKEAARGAVQVHNTDPDSHARALLIAQQERMDMTKQIIVLQTKIDGLEGMLRSLASQGAFDVLAEPPVRNGNGRRK